MNTLNYLFCLCSAVKNTNAKERLNPKNYKNVFNMMIEMEDEVASRQALSHDQTNQRLIHLRQNIYVIKIVSEMMLFVFISFVFVLIVR